MIIDISGYDKMVELHLNLRDDFEVSGDLLEISYDQISRHMTFIWDGESVGDIDVEKLMRDYHERRQGLQPTTSEDSIIVMTEGKVTIKLQIDNLNYEVDDADEIEYGEIHGKMLIDFQ